MEKNVCGLDRVVRLVVGPALLLAGYLRSRRFTESTEDASVSLWHVAVAYAGAELLVTGLLQWCPGNYLLGRDTCESSSAENLWMS